MGSMAGRTALVTGASRGIGLGIVLVVRFVRVVRTASLLQPMCHAGRPLVASV